MSSLYSKIDALLEKAPEDRPSYFQMKYFILGKEPTLQSQLWRCLTELRTKKDSIDNLTKEIANQKDQLELLKIQIEMEKEISASSEEISTKQEVLRKKSSEIKQNMMKRNVDSVEKDINKLEKKLEFVVQEARFYVQSYESLSSTEDIKDFDDFECQKAFWEAKISEEINLRVLTKQGIGADLFKTAISLPDGSAVKEHMINVVNKHLIQEKDGKKTIEWK